MGGFGSGRTTAKGRAEEYRSIDVNRLKRLGCLKPGWHGRWHWKRDDVEVASIALSASTDMLTLDYLFGYAGDEKEPVRQPVPILKMPCHFGGHRTYFQCPGVVGGRRCARRVSKLFAAGRYFLCRHCYQLAYSSQSEPRHDRMLRRANKLRMALGGEAGTAYPVAVKPKGMWQRTYDRMSAEIEWCEYQANLSMIEMFTGRLSAEEIEMYFGD